MKLSAGAEIKPGALPTPAPAPAQPAAPADTAKARADTAKGQAAGVPAAPAAPAAPTDPVLAAGNKLFMSKGCVGCHSLTAIKAPGAMVGPNLAHVGSRKWIAAGTLENTDANLAHWIRNPQSIKQGVLMPNLGLSEQEAQQLVAYFRALAKQ